MGYISVNWLVIEGLMRYGCRKTAAELVRRSLEMVSATGRPLSTENYHPREPVHYELSHNTLCYGWGGLPNDMLLRRVLGIIPRMSEGIIEIDPLWHEELDELRISNLHIGANTLEIEYTKHNGTLRTVIARTAGKDNVRILADSRHKTLGTRQCRFDLPRQRNSANPTWLP